MPSAGKGGGAAGGNSVGVSLRKGAGTKDGAASGCPGGGVALARASASASGETIFGGGSLGVLSGADLANGGGGDPVRGFGDSGASVGCGCCGGWARDMAINGGVVVALPLREGTPAGDAFAAPLTVAARVAEPLSGLPFAAGVAAFWR